MLSLTGRKCSRMVHFYSTHWCLWAESFSVWIVSNEQLLDWVRHPVPVSQLDQVASLKCSTPQVDPNTQICNGIPQNEKGLLSHCSFPDFPFYTCVRWSLQLHTTQNHWWLYYSMDARRLHLHLITRIHLSKFPTGKMLVSAVSALCMRPFGFHALMSLH